MIALLTILLSFIFLTIHYIYKLAQKKPDGFPPGPPSLPIWGGYWFLLSAHYNFTHKAGEYLTKKFKSDIVGLFAGDFPVAVVTGHALVKEALTRDEFIGRPDIFATRNRSLGDLLGIIFTDGPLWKEQRRFSLRHLRDYGFGRRFTATEDIFEREVKTLVDFLHTNPGTNDLDVCCKKGRVLLPDLFYGPLSNAILHMLVGHRFDERELRELGRSSLIFLQNTDTTGRALSITPWIRYFAPKYFGSTQIFEENTKIRNFCQKSIDQRKLTFTSDHKTDFLDSYFSKMKELQNEGVDLGSFSEKQLVWTLVDYLFPAPNVIGPSLNMLWMHLCMFPEVQTKVQEEIDRVVGRARFPTLDDRKNMPYTEAVIRESLRYDPVVPINTPRRCLEDTTLGGFFIPKNTLMLLSIWSANHDPTVWDNPKEFRPERFLDEDGQLLKKDLILSFGAGKRLCAGETFARNSMFLMLSGLLQNYSFKPVDGVPERDSKRWGFIVDIPPVWVDAISR